MGPLFLTYGLIILSSRGRPIDSNLRDHPRERTEGSEVGSMFPLNVPLHTFSELKVESCSTGQVEDVGVWVGGRI